ncbi:hypothetical protein ACFVJK_46810 [Streptomyces sp. NPDC127172]|uniref:hypothetical protein n=1 Tax=Streptomyces sp. NPDC127172 TaxID=3345382 RepID=UPI003634B282
MAGFTIKGITDDTDTCECCGTRIKRAVALMPLDIDGNEDGDVVYYGSTCAGRALGRKTAWVTGQARAAQAKWEADAERAREWLAAYEPVEFAGVREQFRVFVRERNNTVRAGDTVTASVARLLAHARAILAAGI